MVSKISLGDGKEIGFRFEGDRDKPTILFANGSIFNFKQFDLVFTKFIRFKLLSDYSLLFYDYLGVGASSSEIDQFDFVEIAEQQKQILDKLKLDKVHLFGVSKGAIINQIMTARYPERVYTQTAYGSPNLVDDSSSTQIKSEFRSRIDDLKNLRNLWQDKINPDNYRILYDEVFLPTIFDLDSKDKLNIFEKITNLYVRWKLFPMLEGTKIKTIYQLYSYYLEDLNDEEEQRYIDAIKNIEQPTLLLHGTSDETIPLNSSKLLHELYPNSKLVTFDGYDHSSPLFLPWQGWRIISTFAKFVRNYTEKQYNPQISQIQK